MLDRGNNSREPEFDSGVSEPNNEHTHFESSIEIAENENNLLDPETIRLLSFNATNL
jgi:hypothetical protein